MAGSVGAGIVHRFSCKRLDQRGGEKERQRERERESEKEQEKSKKGERERGEGPTGAACCCSNLHCRPAAITVRSLSAQLPAARQRFSITDLSHRAAPELACLSNATYAST